jgi:hypothetical protein
MQIYAQGMRDREVIDSELRRLAAMRRSVRERGGELSTRQVDELLDERLGHRAGPSESEANAARATELVADNWLQFKVTDSSTPHGRKGALRRFGRFAALPLSLIAVTAALVVMFTFHNPHRAAEPAVVPPPSAQPSPGAQPNPGEQPSPGAQLNPATPKTPAPLVDIVDTAFIDVLKQNGVPVPSREYAMIHAHAVCDFLAHQPNVAEAVRSVQQSSIWDAKQSADFAVGAIVSYCPQYEAASSAEMPQAFQNALSDLQAIERDLQGIRGDLQAIP